MPEEARKGTSLGPSHPSHTITVHAGPDGGKGEDIGSDANRGCVDAAAVQPTFFGKPAEQLLAEVDAVAAHVRHVLLPSLRESGPFKELLILARAEREKERERQAAKAEERRGEQAAKKAKRQEINQA